MVAGGFLLSLQLAAGFKASSRFISVSALEVSEHHPIGTPVRNPEKYQVPSVRQCSRSTITHKRGGVFA